MMQARSLSILNRVKAGAVAFFHGPFPPWPRRIHVPIMCPSPNRRIPGAMRSGRSWTRWSSRVICCSRFTRNTRLIPGEEGGGRRACVDAEIARLIAERIGVEARFTFVAAAENLDADFAQQYLERCADQRAGGQCDAARAL